MREFSLKVETEEFATFVVDLVVPRKKKNWKTKIEAKWADVQERGFVERTDSTKKLYMSKFRKAVRDELAEKEENEDRKKSLDDELMEIIRIDKAILTKLQDDYESQRKKQNRNLIVVPEWATIVGIGRELLNSVDVENKILGLLVVTGRRFGEICTTANFASVVERSAGGSVTQKWLVNFSGQLKSASREMKEAVFPIPVLAPAEEVIAALNAVRESGLGRSFAGMTNERLNKSQSHRFNEKLNLSGIANSWPKGAKLTCHEMRALYAEVAYEQFAPRMVRGPYYATVLGHSAEYEENALSYMRYILKPEALAEGREEVNRLTMLRDQKEAEAIAVKKGTQDGGADPDESGEGDLIEE